MPFVVTSRSRSLVPVARRTSRLHFLSWTRPNPWPFLQGKNAHLFLKGEVWTGRHSGSTQNGTDRAALRHIRDTASSKRLGITVLWSMTLQSFVSCASESVEPIGYGWT